MSGPEFDNLKVQVERTNGIAASVAATLTGLSNWVAAHKTDPVALQAFADQLNANSQAITDAITANPLPTDTQLLGKKKP